jgi:hypothetical protein
MTEKQADKGLVKFDFFTKTQKIIQKKVSPLPYAKLAFLGIAVGVGLSIPYSIYTGLEHHWDKKEAQAQAVTNQQIAYYIQAVKEITPAQFAKFTDYLTISQATYDDEMKLLIDSETKAAGQAKQGEDMADVEKTMNEAGKMVTAFKTTTRASLAKYQDIYARVQMGHGSTVTEDDYKDFLYNYHRSEQGFALVDDDIESKINERMYIGTKANQRYNLANGVYTQYEDMKKARSITKIN